MRAGSGRVCNWEWGNVWQGVGECVNGNGGVSGWECGSVGVWECVDGSWGVCNWEWESVDSSGGGV